MEPLLRIPSLMNAGLLRHIACETHVWLADPQQIASPQCEAQFLHYLSQEERIRHSSYCFLGDRTMYLMAHGLLREILSIYGQRAPHEWKFIHSANGKPSLLNGPPEEKISFNLSHTQGAIAVIITRDCDCGVDIEKIRHDMDMELVVPSVMSAAEIETWRRLSLSLRTGFFFETWTIKEAFLKGVGLGLHGRMDLVEVQRRGSNGITVATASDGSYRTAPWRVTTQRISNDHMLATAVLQERSRADRPLLLYTVTASKADATLVVVPVAQTTAGQSTSITSPQTSGAAQRQYIPVRDQPNHWRYG